MRHPFLHTRPAILLVWWLSPLAVSGCGSQNTATQGAAAGNAPVVSLSTDSLVAGLKSLPSSGPGSFAAVTMALGKMSFSQYYTAILQRAGERSLVLDGYSIKALKSSVQARRPALLALGNTYGTVAEWWQAIGFEPRILSVADLRAALPVAFAKADQTLGLADTASSSCGNSNPNAKKTTALMNQVLGNYGFAQNGDSESLAGLASDTSDELLKAYDKCWFGCVSRETELDQQPQSGRRDPSQPSAFDQCLDRRTPV